MHHQYELVIDDYLAQCKKDETLESNFYEPTAANRRELTSEGKSRVYFVDLTEQIAGFLRETGIRQGIVIIRSYHTTSSIFVNHFEPGLMQDIADYLTHEFPIDRKYCHNNWDHFKNCSAHMKCISMGKESTVLIKDGELVLGDFENIIYAEFDARPGKRYTAAFYDIDGAQRESSADCGVEK